MNEILNYVALLAMPVLFLSLCIWMLFRIIRKTFTAKIDKKDLEKHGYTMRREFKKRMVFLYYEKNKRGLKLSHMKDFGKKMMLYKRSSANKNLFVISAIRPAILARIAHKLLVRLSKKIASDQVNVEIQDPQLRRQFMIIGPPEMTEKQKNDAREYLQIHHQKIKAHRIRSVRIMPKHIELHIPYIHKGNILKILEDKLPILDEF